jgi:hypothetical protein
MYRFIPMVLVSTATRRQCTGSLTRALPFAAAIIATLAAAPAPAQDDIAQSFTGSFKLAEKSIPLPAGEWHLVADERTPSTTDARPLPGMRTAILARLDGATVIGLISATVNESRRRTVGASRRTARAAIFISR